MSTDNQPPAVIEEVEVREVTFRPSTFYKLFHKIARWSRKASRYFNGFGNKAIIFVSGSLYASVPLKDLTRITGVQRTDVVYLTLIYNDSSSETFDVTGDLSSLMKQLENFKTNTEEELYLHATYTGWK